MIREITVHSINLMLNQRKSSTVSTMKSLFNVDVENPKHGKSGGIHAPTAQEQNATIESLQKLLEISRLREKRLVTKLENMGIQISLDLEIQSASTNLIMTDTEGFDHCPIEPKTTFYASFMDRGMWLVGLLGVQSLSSFVLAANESLLLNHPSIIYFLTMLVGAGGNAGNQAAVRVIRGIALGSINDKNFKQFLARELLMAVSLSIMLGSVGMIRSFLSPHTSNSESFVISLALVTIVFISIVLGSLLPFGLQLLKFDPAHSSTTIQVIMDILGVVITCTTATILLDTVMGQHLLSLLFMSSEADESQSTHLSSTSASTSKLSSKHGNGGYYSH